MRKSNLPLSILSLHFVVFTLAALLFILVAGFMLLLVYIVFFLFLLLSPMSSLCVQNYDVAQMQQKQKATKYCIYIDIFDYN